MTTMLRQLARTLARRNAPSKTVGERHVAVCTTDDCVVHVDVAGTAVPSNRDLTTVCCCVCDPECAYRPANRCHRRCDDCLRIVMPLYLQKVYESRKGS